MVCMNPLQNFLSRRLDRPWAWMVTFASAGILGGTISGAQQGGLSGAALLACVGAIVGSTVGLIFGCVVWGIVRLIGGLDCQVVSPEVWGIPFFCGDCGWHVGPDGPWSRRDCLAWPKRCPLCEGPLRVHIPQCAQCGRIHQTGLRIPRNMRMALSGGYLCPDCGCEQDKWGRVVGSRPIGKATEDDAAS